MNLSSIEKEPNSYLFSVSEMTTTDESGYETGGPLGGAGEGSPRDRDHVILDSLPLKKKVKLTNIKDV